MNCAWCLGTRMISEVWKLMGKLSCSAKKGQGYGRHFDNFFFLVDQHMWMVLTDVYIREIIPYAYFFPEDGKEDTEIYVVFGLKRNYKLQCAYSGRKNSLSIATLSQGVCPAFWDLPGGVSCRPCCCVMPQISAQIGQWEQEWDWALQPLDCWVVQC